MNTHTNPLGTRIDYILCNRKLLPYFRECQVAAEIMGSDHCPVIAYLAEGEREGDRDGDAAGVEAEAPGVKFKREVLDALQCVTRATTPTYKPPPLCSCYFEEFTDKQKKISHFFSKKTPDSETTAATAVKKDTRPAKQAKLTQFFATPKVQAAAAAASGSGSGAASTTTNTTSTTSATTTATPTTSATPAASLLEDTPRIESTTAPDDPYARYMMGQQQSATTPIPPEFRTDDETRKQQAWSKLPFHAKKPAPLCEHGDPSKEFTGELSHPYVRLIVSDCSC